MREGRGVGLWLPERVALGVAVPEAALDGVALGEGEWLGVAECEGLLVTERLVPIVLLAPWPVEVAPGEETGMTLAAAPRPSESPPSWKVMKPSAPTATAAAAAPPTTTVRFLRRAAFLTRAWPAADWFGRAVCRRSRRRVPGPAGTASTGFGSHTALIAGP